MIEEIQQNEARIQTHKKMIEKYEKKLGQNAYETIGFEKENTNNLRKIASKIGIKSSNKMSREQILKLIKNSDTLDYLTYIHFELRRIYKKNKPKKTRAEELKNISEYTKGRYEEMKLTLKTNDTMKGIKHEYNEKTGQFKEVKYDIRDEYENKIKAIEEEARRNTRVLQKLGKTIESKSKGLSEEDKEEYKKLKTTIEKSYLFITQLDSDYFHFIKKQVEELEEKAKKKRKVERLLKNMSESEKQGFEREKQKLVNLKEAALCLEAKESMSKFYITHLELTGEHIHEKEIAHFFVPEIAEDLKKFADSVTLEEYVEFKVEKEEKEKKFGHFNAGMLKDFGPNSYYNDEENNNYEEGKYWTNQEDEEEEDEEDENAEEEEYWGDYYNTKKLAQEVGMEYLNDNFECYDYDFEYS